MVQLPPGRCLCTSACTYPGSCVKAVLLL